MRDDIIPPHGASQTKLLTFASRMAREDIWVKPILLVAWEHIPRIKICDRGLHYIAASTTVSLIEDSIHVA